MITGRSITMEIGGRSLLKDGGFFVGPNDKAGLVGRNGTGKSSLLSYILGEPGDHLRVTGEIRVDGTVGFLPQVPVPDGLGTDPSGFSHVLSARGLDRLDDNLRRARDAMAEDPTEQRITQFTDLEEQYRNAGGYEVEGKIARLADGLGLSQDLLLEDVCTLSGGQRRRVDLIRVLFQEPQVMVLDEPTNHLDLSAKKWLMDELASFQGAMLVVSHDLRLLDQSISKVISLAHGRMQEFKGTYTSFQTQSSQDIAQREKSAKADSAQLDKMKTQADKWRHSTVAQARKAKVLDRKVDKLEKTRTEVVKRERKVAFKLPVPVRSGLTPLTVSGLGVRYGDHKVLLDVDFALTRGDRVAVVGRNGAGKSSLLRCLAGVQEPSDGSVDIGHLANVGYFAQEHEQIDPERTVLDNIDDTVLVKEPDRRALLGSFGLGGDASMQLPGSLSGGERARLSLAMLAAGQANLLLLDEPTNNLDPASVEAVGLMLAVWKGTIIAVSHDRPFIEALEPTHALLLPDERFTYWRDEYLDEVEVR